MAQLSNNYKSNMYSTIIKLKKENPKFSFLYLDLYLKASKHLLKWEDVYKYALFAVDFTNPKKIFFAINYAVIKKRIENYEKNATKCPNIFWKMMK